MEESSTSTQVATVAPEPIAYDLIVIGSGTGNTLIDDRWAGKRVAIIDRGTFGGTCLNVGCIPTKMFVYPADVMREAARLPGLGVDAQLGQVHWNQIRDRIFGRIDPISAGGLDFREGQDFVDVYTDSARFLAPNTLQVGRRVLTGTQIVVATGSHAFVPELDGVDAITSRLHTSDSIMRLDKLPKSLIILGGGYIAAEFAHVFASFGTHVTIINRSDTLLRREDRDIAERFTRAMRARDHVTVKLRQQVSGFELTPRGVVVETTDNAGSDYEYEAELVLCALGRVPNSADLDPARGGIDVDGDGFIVVDEYQRTTAPGVFALGDVSNPHMLKHVANREGRVVQHNLLHPDDLMVSDHRAIPAAVFSEPQVASVGRTQADCERDGIAFTTAIQSFSDVAYGWAMEDDGEHVVKVIADPTTLEILGAHIIGPQASVLIQPLVQAMVSGLDAHTMARGQYWIHPALTEVVENALLGLGRRIEAEE